MKQKLMAVAVAGALAAPGLAVAQSANVQLYGFYNLRFQHVKYGNNAAGTVASLTKQQLHTGEPARWGLRGTENLGGGLTAYFQVESGFNADGRSYSQGGGGTGSSTLGGRDTYLGLRHNAWGSLQGGGFSTAFKGVSNVWGVVPSLGHGGIIMANADGTGQMPSPLCSTGDGNAVSCAGAVETNPTSFSQRVGNHIQYASPQFAGLVFRVGMSMPDLEAPSSTAAPFSNHKPSLASYSLNWSGGPFTVAGGYEQHRGWRTVALAGANTNSKDTGWTLGGRWNYGRGLLGLGWERIEYGNSALAGGENNFTLDNWVMQGTFNVGPSGTVHAGYSRTAGGKSCGAGFTAGVAAGTGALAGASGGAGLQGRAACGDAGKASVLSVGYDHRLSKRTKVYAVYGRINNGAGTNYYYIAGAATNNGNGTSGALSRGSDVTLFGVGVRHAF